MDAILYIRFSTKDQVKGDSIKRQTDLGNKVAKQQGWHITETLMDQGKSAYHGKNRAKGGQLYEIEERAKRGELVGKVLLVEAMDRLTRQKPLESISLIRDLTESGLTICETSSGRTYNTQAIDDNWTNLIVILAAAAEAYGSSHEKSGRVASAWRATQSGQGMKDNKGADPRLCPDWMTVVDGQYHPIPERADMIRRMFDMCATGYGLRAIGDELRAEQKRIDWPKGELDIRRVGNLLRGRRVLGEYQPQGRTANGREDIGGPVKLYPAIVTLEQFHAAQAGLSSRKGTGGRNRRKGINVLSHLCRCQFHNEGENVPCGSRMTYRSYTKQQPQLACARFARAAECKSNATFRYQSILDGILDEIGSLHLPDSVPGQRTSDLSFELLELNKKKDRLAELADQLILADDPIKEAAYQRFRAQVGQEERELNERALNSERASVTLSPSELAQRAVALRDKLSDDAEARLQMQTYLDSLIDVILMDPYDRTSTVVMFDGFINFKLDRAGNVIARANALPVLDDTQRERLAANDPTAAARIERAIEYVGTTP
ncbi:recombinase family protein [Sphingobium sp. LSP13-1-1.1]|uniref:recombinase family protein n=1 Tax=Sphingobium sp. LSP13-1-1.1 TaxID=3135234 RepID=UPI003426ACF9